MRHAVARLRAERIARSEKPFLARGCKAVRCPECRLAVSHCLCAWRPQVEARSGVSLLMHDVEALKPSNTGWLIADVVRDTSAFGWSRVEVDQRLLGLLDDPQWQPYLVFPGEYAAPERVVSEVCTTQGKRPLFVLLDATWSEARKMFRKSPYLDRFPVLSLEVYEQNLRACAFYQKLGFSPIKRTFPAETNAPAQIMQWEKRA